MTVADRARRGRKTVHLQDILLKIAQAKLVKLQHEERLVLEGRVQVLARLEEVTGYPALSYLKHLRRLEDNLIELRAQRVDGEVAVAQAWRVLELAKRQYETYRESADEEERRRDLEDVIDAQISSDSTSLK